MKQDPGATQEKQLIKKVKQQITDVEHSRRLEECRQLPVQGDIARRFDDQSSSIWAETIWSLPEKVMKFALNAIQDTLPHNSNLHLWRKKPSPDCPLCSERQTLLHVLNHCPVALKKRRYNPRHDAILNLLSDQFTCSHISPHQRVTADLPGVVCSFPPAFASTDSRPDLVIWNEDANTINIIESTIPFETTMADAAARKSDKYTELVRECSSVAKSAQLLTVEVGSRGFLNLASLQELYTILNKPPQKDCKALESDVTRASLRHSFEIWCKRNWKETSPE